MRSERRGGWAFVAVLGGAGAGSGVGVMGGVGVGVLVGWSGVLALVWRV
jgi:hypothetical protein